MHVEGKPRWSWLQTLKAGGCPKCNCFEVIEANVRFFKLTNYTPDVL